MEENLRNKKTKKIRVLYPDPDATDTSSDEIESTQKKPKRKVHEVVVDDHEVKFPSKVAKLGAVSVSDQQSPGKNLVGTKDSNKLITGNKPRYAGVKRAKGGKFAAVIRDPFKKKQIWLGTFATAEAASKAYISKKREFEEKLSAERGFDWVEEDPSPTHDSPSSVLANETFESSGETRRCGGGAAAEEEVSGENEELGFINGVEIVDKYGFLLGEFRWIDDLRIRIDENGCFC